MATISPEVLDANKRNPSSATVANLLAWTFGLAPVLLFVLTWTEDFRVLQKIARNYALPVVAAQLVIIVISFREGFRLGRPKLLPLALVGGLVTLAWVTAARASLLQPSLLRTGIWTIEVGFALGVVNLWHHRMLDLEKFRGTILAGFLLVFGMLVAFVATTEQTPYDRTVDLPAFSNVRWFAYYAVAAVGLAAPAFLRSHKAAWLAGALAFAALSWTGARGGVFAAVVGFALSAMLLRELRPWRVWMRFSVCALAGLILAYGITAMVPFEGQGPDNLVRFGSSNRIEVWKDTIGAILQRPWFGWGEGQFWQIFRGVWPFAHPHNVALQVLLAWGIVGALLCLALAVWTAPRFLKAQCVEAAPFQCAALMVAVYSLIDGALFHTQSLSLFVFCCAAAVAAGTKLSPPAESLSYK